MNKYLATACLVALTLGAAGCARGENAATTAPAASAPAASAAPSASAGEAGESDAGQASEAGGESATSAASGGGGGNRASGKPAASKGSRTGASTAAGADPAGECMKIGISLFWKPGEDLNPTQCIKTSAGVQVKLDPEAEGMTWQNATSSAPGVASVSTDKAGSGTLLDIKPKGPGVAKISVKSGKPGQPTGATWTLTLTVKA